MADNKDDYKIKVRLDLSGIESDSKKIADKIKRGAGASTANLDGEVKKKKESLKLTEKQTLALEKQQRSLERSIKRAKRQGVGGLGGIELAASSGDAIKMGRAQSQLATKVLDQHHKTLDVKNQSLNVSKEQQTLDAENYRIWQLRQQGDARRTKEQQTLDARRNKGQQTLDAENYRIWQLRQQGDARRAKEAERERAAAIRQAKSVQSSAPTGTRILAGAGQLQTDAKFKARDLNNLIDSETHPSLAGRRDSVRGTLESIGSRAKGATDPDQIRELRKEYQAASRDLADLVREQKALNKELNRTNPIASKFGATFKSALLGVASAYALLEGAKAVYKIGSEMDAMRASLLAASGSAEEAGKNFEFIKATAKDLGKDIQTMTGGFNRLGVAMTAQGYTAAETKAAFLSVAESATAFSLDSERTGNVILAMSQMISKQKVSMEELSRQMGESLPTAMKAMEMATGKTGMELNKLISSGQLMTKDVLIPFANALRVLARRNGALAAGQQKVIAQQMRMGSAFKTLIDDMFQKGGNKSFSHIFMDVTKVIEHMTPVIEETGRVVLNLAEAISSVVSQFVLMVGWSDKSVKSAGAVRMAWNLVLSTFLALSEAILLVAWGFAKVNELSDESNARIMEGKRLYSGGTTIFSPPTPQQSKTVTNTTTIGDINITSSSTDPKQSAIEMTSMISNIITAGR